MTANTAANTIDQPHAAGTGLAAQVVAPVWNLVSGVWFMGIGLVAVAGEQTGRAIKALADKGREVQPTLFERGRRATEDVTEAVSGAGEKVRSAAGRAARAATIEPFDEKLSGALQRLGIPTREDIAAMSTKIDGIVERLEALRPARKPARSRER